MRSLPSDSVAVPALKGKQGDRTIYLVLPSNQALTNFFSSEPETSLDQRAQRVFDPRHAADIGQYVQENTDSYVLGALTYAIDQEAEFVPSLDNGNIGVLYIPLSARVRIVDGQHRRAGLRQAVDTAVEVAQDNTAVLLYVEPDLRARRQMFSDMNATPKVVAKSLNVAFDSRDPFAVVANALSKEHPLLIGRVEFEAPRVKAGSDKVYSLGAVYDALKRLVVGPSGRVRNASSFAVEEIRRRGVGFFDMLNAARPDLSKPKTCEQIAEARTKSLLFSSTTLRVLAGAVNMALDQGLDFATFQQPVRQIDFMPTAAMWLRTGFVSPGKTTPNARNQEVLAATREVAEKLGWSVSAGKRKTA